MNRNTPYAPWAALGSFLPQQDVFAPLREHVQLDGKTVIHTPPEQWLDVGVSMLADCASLQQLNTRLRPDTARAAAWGRERVADQSTLTRVLDALTPSAVAQRRPAVEPISRREGQARHHLFAPAPLCLDIDLTGLPAGPALKAAPRAPAAGKKPLGAPTRPGQRPAVP